MKIQVFKHEFSDCVLGFELISSVQIVYALRYAIRFEEIGRMISTERTSSFSNQSNAFSKCS